MENILNNVSVWGLLAMLYTTAQLAWNVIKQKSVAKAGQIARISTHQLRQFLFTNYKPLTVLAVSILLLTIIESQQTFDLKQSIWAFWLSTSLMFLSIIITRFFEKKQLKGKLKQFNYLLFGLNAPVSISVWVISLSAVSVWVLNNVAPQDLLQMLHLWLSIAIAFCLTQLSFKIWKYTRRVSEKPYQAVLLSEERLDTFLGALFGASILGMVFFFGAAQETGFILLPVILGTSILAISAVIKILVIIKIIRLNDFSFNLGRIFMVGIFALLSSILVRNLLPATWMLYGQEYYYNQLIYVAWFGLSVGLISDKIVTIYKLIQTKYTHYFIQKPTQHKYLTYTLRLLITFICFMLMAVVVIYAYQTVGLYGLALALVVMLANTLAKVSLDIPAKFE